MQLKQLRERVKKSLIDSRFEQESRVHEINVSGNAKLVAGGDIIAGDKVQKTDDQYHGEMIEECRLRLEHLAQIVGPVEGPLCELFLDSMESQEVSENFFLQWLAANFLEYIDEPLVPIRIITASRRRHGLSCSPERLHSVRLAAMSDDEARALLENQGVTNPEAIGKIISITRGHPQAIILASRLSLQGDEIDFELPSTSVELYEELCTEFLLHSILKLEKDQLLRRALITIPVLRFFTAEQVTKMLRCSVDETQRIVCALKEGGFVESTQTALKYHDLLQELTLKFIQATQGADALRSLHIQASDAYSNETSDSALVNIVEPFFHLLRGNIPQAVEYCERTVKPALDRKQRTLAAVLIGQIEFDTLPDSPQKGWLLLRYGGYFREFRDFPRAIQIFELALTMVGGDARLRASVLNNIGWVYLYWDKTERAEIALQYFKESNAICISEGFDDILAMNYNNMGIGHSRLSKGDTHEELGFYSLSLAITENEKHLNPLVAGMALQNAGFAYQKMREYDRARAVMDQALKRFRICNCPQREAEMIYHIARVLFDSKEYGKSRDFLDYSLRALQARTDRDPYYLGENFFALARVLELLGELENMKACLLSMIKISLAEGVQYHVVVAHRAAQYCRYLYAVYGGDVLRDTVSYLQQNWVASDEGREHVQFSEFIHSEGERIESHGFWANGKSRIVHLPLIGCCTPTQWQNVRLRNKKAGVAVLCKRCRLSKKQS